ALFAAPRLSSCEFSTAARGAVSSPREIQRRRHLRFREAFFGAKRVGHECGFFRGRRSRGATECLFPKECQPWRVRRCARLRANAGLWRALHRLEPLLEEYVAREGISYPRTIQGHRRYMGSSERIT